MSDPIKNYAAFLSGRMRRLTESLAELRERVRMAVAEELAKVIAEAVREVVTLTVGRQPVADESSYRRRVQRYAEDGWDEERSEWDGYEPQSEYSRSSGRYRNGDPEAAAPYGVHPAALRSAALAIGVGVARWCIRRRGTTFISLAIGLAAGMTALAGGPLTRAGIATLATARDLLGIADTLDAGAVDDVNYR